MSQQAELLATAERVVERAKSRLPVQEAEAFVALERDVAVHFEKNSARMVASRESYGIAIRVLVAGRLGFSFVTREDEVAHGIDQAIDASRLSKKTPFTFPRPRTAKRVAGLWDSRVDAIQAEEVVTLGMDTIGAVLDVRKDLNAAGGGVSTGVAYWGVSNSEGVAVAQRQSGFSASCYVVQERDAVSTGSAHRSSSRRDFRVEDVGREAARLAVESAKPQPLADSRVREVVVTPDAAAELLGTITVSSLSGRAAHRQESFYTGKLGHRVAADDFGLVEDATVAGGLGSGPFDDEGVPSRAVRLISKGVLKSYLFDVATGAEYRARSTASAVRSGGLDGRSFKAPPMVAGRQVRVVSPRTSTERLVAGVDDGILVHDMMGVHTANTVSGDFGVTASLLFRIRKGAVEGAVEPVSVSGNLHASLKKGLRMGDDFKHTDVGTAFHIPSVLFHGFTVTP